ncbi:PIN domain-like protein [Mycena olivaceomarginata]|nr:PIN domain-like protein [Mycena olivaceomarginata]
MGIEGFWAIAAHSAQVISLKDLNARDGNGRSTKAIIVGVDASLWLTQCQAVVHKPRHAQMGRNPELRALFYKLASLSDAQVITSSSTPTGLWKEFTELIELFGFYFYMAPGEGEAELAHLSKHGFIDAVLTDDEDTALFGAPRIFESLSSPFIVILSLLMYVFRLNKKNKDEITVYTSEALQNNPDIRLTNGGILLLAVLNGGDYDTVGLAKCGATVAHALARCGFGDSLLEAAQNMSQPALQHFLVAWRQELREELKTNSQGHLRSKQPSLVRTIPNNLPNLTALSLYSCPTTSWSEGFFPPITDGWIVKLPSLPELALYCKRMFGWSAVDMVDRFKCLIFPGMFAKRITLPFDINTQLYEHVVLRQVQEEQPPLSAFWGIISYDTAVPPKYKLKLSVAGLTNWTISQLEAPASAAGPASATTTQWFCAPAFEHYFPALVARFNGASIPAPASAAAEAPVDVFGILDSPVFPAAPLPRWLGLIELSDSEEEGSSKVNIIDLTLDYNYK